MDMNHKMYKQSEPHVLNTNGASLAIRQFGDQGDAIVFVHGLVVHGYTWRHLLPELSKNHRCYVLDLPGFGSSHWDQQSDLSFSAQAQRVADFINGLNVPSVKLIAHDTGASIARMVAIQVPERISDLVCINTEIPHHRPPYIRMHQWLARLPFANHFFRFLLKFDAVVKSPVLLNQFFSDKTLLNKENLGPYLQPLKTSKNRMMGMLKCLMGIEWDVVDGFSESHKKIQARTLFLWGEDDKTFPIEQAYALLDQFSCPCELIRIQNAALMPHEEQPEQVTKAIKAFIS